MAQQQGIYESMWSPTSELYTVPTTASRRTGFLLDGTEMRLDHVIDRQMPPSTSTDPSLDSIVGTKVQREVQRAMMPFVAQQQHLLAISKADLRTLERKLYEVEASLSVTHRLDYAPTANMKEEYSKEELSQAYIEAAEAREEVSLRVDAVARRLRNEADALRRECHVDKTPTTTSSTQTSWMPAIVHQMPVIAFHIPDDEETFTFDFLTRNLGGDLWSSGFFFDDSEDCILPSHSYWLLDSDSEPFAPSSPGQHGAKLTALFNNTAAHSPLPKHYMNVPVFIIEKGSKEYRYYGNYSQTRCPDVVGYDTMVEHVPKRTLRQWADQLSDNKRPAWVTQALMKHLWPQPKYAGPIPDSAINSVAGGCSEGPDLSRALNEYAEQLKLWETDAKVRVNLIKSDDLFKNFTKPDQDVEPGLRLWWEYMECVKYDSGFYEMLVKFKHQPKLQKRSTKMRVENITVPTPEEEESAHPPRQDPKKVQVEQWKVFDRQEAEKQAKKLTTFVKSSDSEGPPMLKTDMGRGKGDDLRSGKRGVTHPSRDTKTNGAFDNGWGAYSGPRHTVGGNNEAKKTNPTFNDSWAASSSSWEAVGDIRESKKMNDTTNRSWGVSATSLRGIGDIDEAKKFRDEIPEKRWKHDKYYDNEKQSKANGTSAGKSNGAGSSNGIGIAEGGGRGGALPPHARGR